MPVISEFLGIVIMMYFYEHAPPHFHARYGEYEITVNIKTGVITGQFPKRALKLVMEWYEIHKEELLQNWDNCISGQTPMKILPLE